MKKNKSKSFELSPNKPHISGMSHFGNNNQRAGKEPVIKQAD